MNRKLVFVLIVIAILIIVVISVFSLSILLQLYRSPKYLRVYSRGFEEYSAFIAYIAEFYIGDSVVRDLYVRIPKPDLYSKILISISAREISRLKSLEVEITASPGKVPELAWISTSIEKPVEFYRNGNVIVWRCRDLGVYGEGTLTLEFTPYSSSLSFEDYTFSVKAIVEYRGVDYTVEHTFTIPKLTSLIISMTSTRSS